MSVIKKSTNNNAGEGVEKREPSYTVGGNANWYSHYGEQCRDSFKNFSLKVFEQGEKTALRMGENNSK